jgi:hypothetical protein
MSMRLDSAGNVYVAGDTSSSSFLGMSLSIKKGYPMVFFAKIASAWTLEYAGNLGGSNIDYGRSMALKEAAEGNSIYLTGGTLSRDFRALNSLYGYSGSFDAFVASFGEGGQEPEPPSPPKPPKPPKK